MKGSFSKVLRWAIPAGLLLVLTAAFIAKAFIDPYQLRSAARKRWAREAISEIASHANDSAWRKAELEILKNSKGHPELENWVSDRLILMENGDWIIYRSRCRKEQEGPRISDIMVGKGSDGKFYYSTFHFCIGMCGIMGEEQASDLDTFVRRFSLRAFDGNPKNCLERTWFPGERNSPQG